MQHFILNGKILELEKNKETHLPIPVLFNAGTAEFTLEIPLDQHKTGAAVELSIYHSSASTGLKKIVVELPAEIRRFQLRELAEIEAKDFLLYSCKANISARLSLSIVALN